jgi:adenylyltransferase/sulfurtransferase
MRSKQSEANFSQAKVLNFHLDRYQRFRVVLIGAGAIGTHVAVALVRKGIGFLHIFDDDTVELKNLPRQLFSTRDVGKNKAVRLSKMIAKHGFFQTIITGYPCTFQEALEMGETELDFFYFDCVICAVDNNPSRVFVAKYCLEERIPLVASAVSRDGNQMYCAVQEPGKACFGCVVPHAVNDDSYPCNLPGIIDIIQVVSGYTVYALDTLLMDRPREWNIKTAFLDGGAPDQGLMVPKKSDCTLCGTKHRGEPEKPDQLSATRTL